MGRNKKTSEKLKKNLKKNEKGEKTNKNIEIKRTTK